MYRYWEGNWVKEDVIVNSRNNWICVWKYIFTCSNQINRAVSIFLRSLKLHWLSVYFLPLKNNALSRTRLKIKLNTLAAYELGKRHREFNEMSHPSINPSMGGLTYYCYNRGKGGLHPGQVTSLLQVYKPWRFSFWNLGSFGPPCKVIAVATSWTKNTFLPLNVIMCWIFESAFIWILGGLVKKQQILYLMNKTGKMEQTASVEYH